MTHDFFVVENRTFESNNVATLEVQILLLPQGLLGFFFVVVIVVVTVFVHCFFPC